MSRKCPSCGVNNPARAKACALCKSDLTSGQQVVGPAEPAPVPSMPFEPAGTQQTSASLVLEAPFMRTRGLIGTLVMGLMLLPMMVVTLVRAPTTPLMALFAWILVALFIPQVLLLIRPRRLVVEGGRFIARGMPTLTTALENLFMVAHDGVGLCVRFDSLEQVDCPAKWRQIMEQNSFKTGYHLSFPGFTFAQAELLREKVGLPEQPFHSSLTHVRSYQQAIRQLTPRILVTYVLVALNCLVYLLMVATGVHWLTPSMPDLLNWGADFGPYTTHGQGWRLLTCCFVHVGVFHLFFNMWALLSFGPMMERLLGQTGFLLVYVVSGLFGSIVSQMWNPLVVSAGASGAIFGIFGAMLGFLVLHRQSMPGNIYSQVWRSGVAFLVYNFLFAWGMPGINVAAHLGGAVAGFFSGMVLSQPLDEHTRRMRMWRNLLLAGMAVVLLGPAFFLLPSVSGPQAEWTKAMIEYSAREQKLIDRYNEVQQRLSDGQASYQELQNILTRSILPEWTAWHQRISALQPTKPRDIQFQRDLVRYLQLQREGWELQATAIEKDDSEVMQQANAKFAAAQEVVRRMNGR